MSTTAPTSTKRSRPLVFRLNVWMLVLLVIVAAFQAIVSNDQVTNGRKLAQLQDQRDELQVTIDEQQRQVDAISSLTYIRQYATDKLGMQPVTKNLRYLPLIP